MITINQLLKDVIKKEIHRVLWIESENIFAYLIEVDNSKAMPFKVSINDLEEDLLHGRIVEMANDPYLLLTQKKEASPKSIEIRDRAWLALKEIVNKEPDIYERSQRGSLIQEIVSKFDITLPTVYKYLRRYWQRGKCPNALLADYDNSGGKGKLKTAGTSKRGNPGKNRDKQSQVNVDEETLKIIQDSLNRFYLNEKQNSLTQAYKLMIRTYYTIDRYWDWDNQIEKVVIKEAEQRPTMRQFRYWAQKLLNPKEITISRKGKKIYNKDYRALLGSSTYEVKGPGSRFHIDSTIGDIYLVSRLNRDKIIGRPVIYLVIDVFSRMITGVHVGLEGSASYVGAMMALANAATDKVEFCKKYGIDIKKEQWPCFHLPEAILADRGELVGEKIETLINMLNVDVENTGPYRADMKGIVERQFRTMQEKIKPFVPGYVDKDYKQRGARDYRLDADLDIYEYTQIVIEYILYHNNHHYIDNYPIDAEMSSNQVLPIPIELWKWGITHRSGKLRTCPPDIVKLSLMPQDTATITGKGIKFKGMYYGCDRAIKEFWFEKARRDGGWKINISYDPRDVEFIYMRVDDENKFITCQLLDHQEKYIGKSMDEVNYFHEVHQQSAREYKDKQLQSDMDFVSKVQAIVKKDRRSSSEKSSQLSKSQRTKNIRGNRKEELEKLKKEDAFRLEDSEQKKGEVLEFKSKQSNVQSSDIFKFIEEKQKEQLNERRDN